MNPISTSQSNEQAVKQRLDYGMLRLFQIAASTLLCLVAAAGHAQVLSVASDEGRILAMPSDPSTVQGAVVDGVSLSVGIEGDYRVYRAVFRGETHVAHVSLDGPPRHMAFDPGQQRFRQVLPSLVVELGDYARLEEVVQAVGGVAGKSYEHLGFAVVQLPETANPAEAAQALDAHAAVIDARVQLRQALHVPL